MTNLLHNSISYLRICCKTVQLYLCLQMPYWQCWLSLTSGHCSKKQRVEQIQEWAVQTKQSGEPGWDMPTFKVQISLFGVFVVSGLSLKHQPHFLSRGCHLVTNSCYSPSVCSITALDLIGLIRFDVLSHTNSTSLSPGRSEPSRSNTQDFLFLQQQNINLHWADQVGWEVVHWNHIHFLLLSIQIHLHPISWHYKFNASQHVIFKCTFLAVEILYKYCLPPIQQTKIQEAVS